MHPLAVFGGPDPTAKAQGPARAERDRRAAEARRRYQETRTPALYRQGYRWTQVFETVLKDLLHRAGMVWIQSPQEADHQLAHLFRTKVIAAAVANDGDLILAGIPVIDLITANYKRVYNPSIKLTEATAFSRVKDRGLLPLLGVLCDNDYNKGLGSTKTILNALDSNKTITPTTSLGDVYALLSKSIRSRKVIARPAPSPSSSSSSSSDPDDSVSSRRAPPNPGIAEVSRLQAAQIALTDQLVFDHKTASILHLSGRLPSKRGANNLAHLYDDVLGPRPAVGRIVADKVSSFTNRPAAALPEIAPVTVSLNTDLTDDFLAQNNVNATDMDTSERRRYVMAYSQASAWATPAATNVQVRKEISNRALLLRGGPGPGVTFVDMTAARHSARFPRLEEMIINDFIMNATAGDPTAADPRKAAVLGFQIHDSGMRVSHLEVGTAPGSSDYIVKANITSSVANEEYKVCFKATSLVFSSLLDKAGEGTLTEAFRGITDFYCECKAGLGICKHLLALMYTYSARVTAMLTPAGVTEGPCLWARGNGGEVPDICPQLAIQRRKRKDRVSFFEVSKRAAWDLVINKTPRPLIKDLRAQTSEEATSREKERDPAGETKRKNRLGSIRRARRKLTID